MTATLEDLDLHEVIGGVPCDHTLDGVPCPNVAEWIGNMVPCGCVRLICTPCKEQVSALMKRHSYKDMQCARCLHGLRRIDWETL